MLHEYITHLYTHTHTDRHTRTHTHIHTHARTHARTHAHTHTLHYKPSDNDHSKRYVENDHISTNIVIMIMMI